MKAFSNSFKTVVIYVLSQIIIRVGVGTYFLGLNLHLSFSNGFLHLCWSVNKQQKYVYISVDLGNQLLNKPQSYDSSKLLQKKKRDSDTVHCDQTSDSIHC